MRTNTCSVLPWHVRLSQRNSLRSQEKKVLLPSATALPVKEMTRSVSSSASKPLLRISKIIAPWRMTDVWTMQSREDELAYCKAHGIDLPFDANHSYSRDRNLWHISHEGLELEDPSNEPNYDDLLVLTHSSGKSSGRRRVRNHDL